MGKIKVFKSLEKAEADGTLWGEDLIVLSKYHIQSLLEGKALKTDNGEYVQIIVMTGRDQ